MSGFFYRVPTAWDLLKKGISRALEIWVACPNILRACSFVSCLPCSKSSRAEPPAVLPLADFRKSALLIYKFVPGVRPRALGNFRIVVHEDVHNARNKIPPLKGMGHPAKVHRFLLPNSPKFLSYS